MTPVEPQKNIDEAIIRALCYSDIFGFPLTLEEIVRFSPEDITIDEARNRLSRGKAIRTVVKKNSHYYYLDGREENCELRDRREGVSKRKLDIAIKRLTPLQGIPFLKSAMITGALAAFNSPEGDDIDLLIISAPRRIWTTYFFLRVWRMFGHNPDVCFNMFFSEEDLELTGTDRNFFYAREVLGGIPVYNEFASAESLFNENPWIYRFFPSYFDDEERRGFSLNRSPRWRRRRQRLEKMLSGPMGDVFEYIVRKTQFRQMVKSTPGAANRMSPSRIKLHKSDNRPPILNKYEQNVRSWLHKYENWRAA